MVDGIVVGVAAQTEDVYLTAAQGQLWHATLGTVNLKDVRASRAITIKVLVHEPASVGVESSARTAAGQSD